MIERKSLEVEKAILVGVINSDQDEIKSNEYLDELKFLTQTSGGKVINKYN